MKNLIFAFLLLLPFKGLCQVIADPATGQIRITSISDVTLNPNLLGVNTVIKLKIPLYNLHMANGLPAGSCKFRIGLGTKLTLDSTFDLATTTSGNHFIWTSELSGGQVQINGNLTSFLPQNYFDTAIIRIKGNIPGSSTVTVNFLVTNHSTATTLSDENPSNNNTSLPYTLSASAIPLPVNFTSVNATKNGCTIKIHFTTEQEIEVLKYQIEISRDGINYFKTGEISAAGLSNYNYSFPLTEANRSEKVFIRIKSIDRDGKFQYSSTKSINGTCHDALKINSYPNPVRGSKNIFIASQGGLLNGNYRVLLFTINGELIESKQIFLNSVTQFEYRLGNISAGKYLLKLENKENMETSVLQFEKI